MDNVKLLPTIIQTWLDYLRLEDLANARVEKNRGIGQCQRIIDRGIRLAGNRLLLDKTLFEELKQDRQNAIAQGDIEDVPLALAFPTIRQVRGKGQTQRVTYHPLFTIDVAPILQKNYRESGWDLLDYEPCPIAVNLIEFGGLEESDVDSLTICDGVLRLLRDIFKRPFNTLQDCLNQIDLPRNNCSSDRAAYLTRTNLTSYNTKLKEELRVLHDQSLDPSIEYEWMQDGHPANLYLFGRPDPSEHKVLFETAFEGTAPDEFQAQALKHTQQNRLTTVFGGPGSGKTELALHLLSQPIFQRARSIVRENIDQSSLCVFASSNNGALKKFQERLNNRIANQLVFLPGGNRQVVKAETLSKLQKAIEWLEAQEFDLQEYESIKQKFVDAENKLYQELEQEPFRQQQRSLGEAELKEIETELESLTQAIATLEDKICLLQEEGDYSAFPELSYLYIQFELEKALKQLPSPDQSWFKQVVDWATGTTAETILAQLESQILSACLETQKTPFLFQPPTTEEELASGIEDINHLFEQLVQWKTNQRKIQVLQEDINQKQQRAAVLLAKQQTFQVRLKKYPNKDFYSRFYEDNHRLQVQLLEYAWRVLSQESLRRKPDVLNALKTYKAALLEDEEALLVLKLNPHPTFGLISLIFPVICSTLQSLANMFPSLESNLVRLAIVDEAASTQIHQVFPLLVRSRKAVLMGDPNQIEPITNLCANTIESYWKSAFQARGLDFQSYSCYAPTAKEATAYHRAAGVFYENDLGAAILLANHYRSVPQIISFCSPNYPKELIIQTRPYSSALGSNLLAYHVDGIQINQSNLAEVDSVEKLVEVLLKHGYELEGNQQSKTIGVLSPFFHQAQALKYRLRSRWRNFPIEAVNTIHQFQGGEKAAIVLSPGHCQRNHLTFLNRRPNLLNTAVSRAEELFILVGNLHELEVAGGETKRLVQHIQQHGEIRSLPD